ncbi:fucose isomerase [Thermovenabulum sp.]|uniref:fucose isomerase n=1 Tax=Thermovenabulum sp. TaxID=3100335 RepID=UPI003C7A5918
MRLNVIQLMSPLHGEEKVKESLAKTYTLFNENFEVTYFDYGEINDEFANRSKDLTLVWIMTGGTEEKFKNIFDYLPRPVILLAEDINNSLAASLEIMSFVSEYKKEKAYLLYNDKDQVLNKIKRLSQITKTISKVALSNIGSIGGPSGWLISSAVDYEGVKRRWGLNIVDITMEEFYKTLESSQGDYDGYFDKALKRMEPEERDLVNSHRVYNALKSLTEKYRLNALTLKCFDLLMKYGITGCPALSRLTDEGIIAGCEGDLPSTFSMYISYLLTGEIPFMANPSSVDVKKNTIIFAHCTVPTKAVKNYILRSHFESGMGVGIRGEFEKGRVTILKFGGEDLSKVSFAKGKIVDNPESEFRCRTQIEVYLEKDVEDFLSGTLGNHQVIILGDHTESIKDLIAIKGLNVKL